VKRAPSRGYSHVEVLVSVVLLGVLLVPALEALQTGITTNQGAALAARHAALRDKMERVLAKPFYELYVETYTPSGNTPSASAKFSDLAGADNRRNVVVYRYDPAANARTANDTGVLFVAVYYESDGPNAALSTLLSRWW
jgi:Tfp pilus assembly protein PilE